MPLNDCFWYSANDTTQTLLFRDYREDEDDVTAFPVVKETGDKLIETGINTLQRTLLLKKEVEVEKVDVELEGKRNEFRARMESCSQRQVEVQKKQQRVRQTRSPFFCLQEALRFICLRHCTKFCLRHCTKFCPRHCISSVSGIALNSVRGIEFLLSGALH